MTNIVWKINNAVFSKNVLFNNNFFLAGGFLYTNTAANWWDVKTQERHYSRSQQGTYSVHLGLNRSRKIARNSDAVRAWNWPEPGRLTGEEAMRHPWHLNGGLLVPKHG